jgi:hypothetical protein
MVGGEDVVEAAARCGRDSGDDNESLALRSLGTAAALPGRQAGRRRPKE